MAETKICYDRWINGKPYPITYTYCDTCHEKYIDPVDAITCESMSFEPKYTVGDRVKLAYVCDDVPNTEGVILEVIPKPGMKGSKKHRVEYRVVFKDYGEDLFRERELISCI